MPELLRLVVVLEHKRVKVTLASDLELGLARVLLYPRRCDSMSVRILTLNHGRQSNACVPLVYFLPLLFLEFVEIHANVQEASLRRQISMKDLMSETS